MAFTCVTRVMEIGSLKVIPYEPKAQKTPNRPSKPLVLPRRYLEASQRINSDRSLAETSPEML